ncbi:MAG: quinol dehydrogenase rane component [Firmicutes bacterium]|nr:quinol dehydrogenase rane component [Bacillota bacterium]
MRKTIQPYLFLVLLAFLTVGLFYPAIDLLAMICMLAPMIVAVYKGRYWCGNFCPRGSFFDNVIAKISPRKPIPAVFRNSFFRIFMILFIMSVFGIQTYYAWGDLSGMGAVFIRIILVTTVVGILLGGIFHQRTWCSFCPMGTLASWVSARKKPMPLMVENSCVNCKICTAACPLQLSPYTEKGSAEGFVHSDCLKCNRCVEKCPKKAVGF